MKPIRYFLLPIVALLVPCSLAQAAFHLMQIEQVIGGVNGDTSAQAVQLRMRSAGQNLVSNGRLVVVDATGANPVVLQEMTTNVANGSGGARVLLTTPNFANYTNIPLVTNFVMNPIPVSYLAAGQLRFTDNGSTIYWSLSWGGAAYTGPVTGALDNDANGNFGPPVAVALPSTTLQALQFTGTAAAASTTNLAQYAVTAGTATFVNNAGTSFVVTPQVLPGDYNGDNVVDEEDYTTWRDNLGTNFALAGNGTQVGASAGIVDNADYDYWKAHFGDTPGAGSGSGGASLAPAIVPEPATCVLLSTLAALALRRRRR